MQDTEPASSIICTTLTVPVSSLLVLYVIVHRKEDFSIAKQFWQHTGEGISSRAAEYALRILSEKRISLNAEEESNVYLEERFGRSMDLSQGETAKNELRSRLAASFFAGFQKEAQHNYHTDVYFFPSGMSSIYNAHRLLLGVFGSRKAIQFGFPYIDTLKVLERFGPGCHFYGVGDEQDVRTLDKQLSKSSFESVLGLFCEFPTNPLLKSPDLKHLRALADCHGFPIVVDETLGNPCNVDVLSRSDVVVSSLTKIFSGDSNVMGGCLILNPSGRWYTQLKRWMEGNYEDTFWFEDAIFLERNSRDFRQRIDRVNVNAESLCDFLSQHPCVEKIFYPKYVDTSNYERCRRPTSSNKHGSYGGLFSMLLRDSDGTNARKFYDSLSENKGPSLGTNFTLTCPYTILAHYTELDFAESFGISRYLIRVSIGLEEYEELEQKFSDALASCVKK